MRLEDFFKKFSSKSDEWNEQELKRAMLKIGFEFEDDQVDELFNIIDANRRGCITMEDFEKSIMEQNIDINGVLRKLRRQIVKKEIFLL